MVRLIKNLLYIAISVWLVNFIIKMLGITINWEVLNSVNVWVKIGIFSALCLSIFISLVKKNFNLRKIYNNLPESSEDYWLVYPIMPIIMILFILGFIFSTIYFNVKEYEKYPIEISVMGSGGRVYYITDAYKEENNCIIFNDYYNFRDGKLMRICGNYMLEKK